MSEKPEARPMSRYLPVIFPKMPCPQAVERFIGEIMKCGGRFDAGEEGPRAGSTDMTGRCVAAG